MGIKDEFAKFGAIQKNVQWSVSAFNDRDELVLSLWDHKDYLNFDREQRKYTYRDNIHRWSGLGRNEMEQNLNLAWQKGAVIRMIVSRLKNLQDMQQVNAGADASQFPKMFHAQTQLTGRLIKWDGAEFELEFVKEAP